jgi:predicted MFS family arabinose efflux permease
MAALGVLLPFAAGYYVSYLFRSVNAVIAPELTRELGIGAGQLGFLTSTYFLSFAAAQLPVGAALDRHGPRRVVAVLLLLAALGAVIFATGHDFARLALGRGLIGLGVSASLMGALKAFTVAFSPQRQASVTGLIMAAGAFGALSASLPVEWLLPVWGWRGSLAAVAVMSVAASILIAGWAPRQPPAPPLPDARGALLGILRASAFWRYAPQAALFTGGYMALQGLWAGPWLMHVQQQTRAQAAFGLMLLNLGALLGQLAIGLLAIRLHRAGFHRARLMGVGLGLALLAEGYVILWPSTGAGAGVPWFLFGFFGAASAQVYGVTAQAFAPALSGRVSTAVNQFAFVGAFVLQWGIGAAIETLGRRMPAAQAFRVTLAALLVLQLLSVAWAVRPALRRGDRPPALA